VAEMMAAQTTTKRKCRRRSKSGYQRVCLSFLLLKKNTKNITFVIF